jgi:hypothetical protein
MEVEDLRDEGARGILGMRGRLLAEAGAGVNGEWLNEAGLSAGMVSEVVVVLLFFPSDNPIK